MIKSINNLNIYEYAVIGAGPAAICSVASLLKNKLVGDPKQISWIDPQFQVGNFGTTYSKGSSVPGNTAVSNYLATYNEIYELVKGCSRRKFDIDSLDGQVTCSIKKAAEPLQYITDCLKNLVTFHEGVATSITTENPGYHISLKLNNGNDGFFASKRVILAIGSEPRTITLPETCKNIEVIDPHICFISSEINEYLKSRSNIKKVAVIGSSHSAALATMHLLKAGVRVKQFMNKDYRFAELCVSPDGVKYTKYDNTGLKGEVATFTKQLLQEFKKCQGEYINKLQYIVSDNRTEMDSLLEEHLHDCSHVVPAIGYKRKNTLKLDNQPIKNIQYDYKMTNLVNYLGVFGVGIAFPEQITTATGETEFSVGVSKFWATVNRPHVIKTWQTAA